MCLDLGYDGNSKYVSSRFSVGNRIRIYCFILASCTVRPSPVTIPTVPCLMPSGIKRMLSSSGGKPLHWVSAVLFLFVPQNELGSTRFWKQSSESRRLLVFKYFQKGSVMKAFVCDFRTISKLRITPKLFSYSVGLLVNSPSPVLLGTIKEDSMDQAMSQQSLHSQASQPYCILLWLLWLEEDFLPVVILWREGSKARKQLLCVTSILHIWS